VRKEVSAIVNEYLPERDKSAAEFAENMKEAMSIKNSVKESIEIHLPQYVFYINNIIVTGRTDC